MKIVVCFDVCQDKRLLFAVQLQFRGCFLENKNKNNIFNILFLKPPLLNNASMVRSSWYKPEL